MRTHYVPNTTDNLKPTLDASTFKRLDNFPTSEHGVILENHMNGLFGHMLKIALAVANSATFASLVPTVACKTKTPEVTLRLFDRPSSRKVWIHYAIPNAAARDANKNKNAGGQPPALEGPSIRGIQVIYTTMRPSLLKQFATNLLEEVILEILPSSQEALLRGADLLILILNCSELDAANEIRHLRKPIIGGLSLAVHDRLLTDNQLERMMKNMRDYALPIVVIDLNPIESLKRINVVEKKGDQIALHPQLKPIHVFKMVFTVQERTVSYWSNFAENFKALEHLVSIFNDKPIVWPISPEQWREVEWDIRQFTLKQRTFVANHKRRNFIILIMKQQGEQVVLGIPTHVAGLIDKNRKIAHRKISHKYKNAGGEPPALGRSPYVETCLTYTTNRNVYSIISSHEHMFSTINKNICSTYRKAA